MMMAGRQHRQNKWNKFFPSFFWLFKSTYQFISCLLAGYLSHLSKMPLVLTYISIRHSTWLIFRRERERTSCCLVVWRLAEKAKSGIVGLNVMRGKILNNILEQIVWWSRHRRIVVVVVVRLVSFSESLDRFILTSVNVKPTNIFKAYLQVIAFDKQQTNFNPQSTNHYDRPIKSTNYQHGKLDIYYFFSKTFSFSPHPKHLCIRFWLRTVEYRMQRWPTNNTRCFPSLT